MGINFWGMIKILMSKTIFEILKMFYNICLFIPNMQFTLHYSYTSPVWIANVRYKKICLHYNYEHQFSELNEKKRKKDLQNFDWYFYVWLNLFTPSYLFIEQTWMKQFRWLTTARIFLYMQDLWKSFVIWDVLYETKSCITRLE